METVPDHALRSLLVVGGGSAGWMAAAAIKSAAPLLRVELVESEEIGIVGVGEATIPPIRAFNRQLGIAEDRFVAETMGSFKLGIRFQGWGRAEGDYFHPFGSFAVDFDPVPLHHWWLREKGLGRDPGPLDDYAMAWGAARRGRFQPPVADPRLVQSTHDYAYHFDAFLYAALLRRLAEARGVVRHEGRIEGVARSAETGDIEAVILADGRRIEADFFIDASGFRSLLLGEALDTPFEDWSRWLPCDRALALPTANGKDIAPYTLSMARPAGWQWRIPLQHRTGNGHVFASAFMDEGEAEALLLSHLEGAALAEPRLLKFRTGRRRQSWVANVVAIGLAAGFMEPLESTSIHLVQSAITRLLALFPARQGNDAARAEYNRVTAEEWERVRDFLILHYHLNNRDEPLWRHCAQEPPPDTLAWKIEQFAATGRLVSYGYELFQNPSWLAVHIGQGHLPAAWDALADQRAGVDAAGRLAGLRRVIAEAAEAMPRHLDFIRQSGMAGRAERAAA
jgi:tryptophan halogenase